MITINILTLLNAAASDASRSSAQTSAMQEVGASRSDGVNSLAVVAQRTALPANRLLGKKTVC
jgi:hypothetical protein